MIRRIDVTLAAAALSLLAACTLSVTQPSLPVRLGAPVAPFERENSCTGTHGVKVAPCPILLTKRTRAGIVVRVSGSGVVTSYLTKLNSCRQKKLCYDAERVGNSETRWRMTSGKECGRANVEFKGVDENGSVVGHAFLKLANDYCSGT